MFDGNLRKPFDAAVAPVGAGLQRLGVSPDVITGIGVVMAGACAVAIARGQFFLAFVLLLATGIPDALDGAVAKAGGIAGPRGAFLDSVSDRLSDGLIFAGAAWYYLDGDEPRMAMLPVAVLIVSLLVSYMRAKAESLGFDAKGGLMERAERFIAMAIGLALTPVFSWLFTWTLVLMLVLTAGTAVFRFHKVWVQASAGRPRPTTTRTAKVVRRRRARKTERPRSSRARARRSKR